MEAAGRRLDVEWRFFSLSQVNSSVRGWTAWDAPLDTMVRGRLAFMAAEFARRRGDFADFHWRLLSARHEQSRRLDDPEAILDVAAGCGLPVDELRRAFGDRELLHGLRTDHLQGVRNGVFGTPTLVFPDAGAAYVRIRPAPEAGEAVTAFDELSRLVAARPYMLEIKRPEPPGDEVLTAAGG